MQSSTAYFFKIVSNISRINTNSLSTHLSIQGPFVIIDDLIRLLSECTLPEQPQSGLPVLPEGQTNGIEAHPDEKMDSDQQRRGVKRPGKDHDSDDESASVAPPVNDIYRSRQQKRVH